MFFQGQHEKIQQGGHVRIVASKHIRLQPNLEVSQGSYFLLADYSAVSDLDDMDFAAWLTKEHGVASIPLSPFYSAPTAQKVIRFCFAKTKEVLEQAAERLTALSVV